MINEAIIKETPPEQYSIRQLSEISGVNAVTIRAWERRYGLLKPSRTTKGHRFYDDADIDMVRNILNWLDRMHARPAYQRMVAKARPNGMLSPPMPLPDEARPPPR